MSKELFKNLKKCAEKSILKAMREIFCDRLVFYFGPVQMNQSNWVHVQMIDPMIVKHSNFCFVKTSAVSCFAVCCLQSPTLWMKKKTKLLNEPGVDKVLEWGVLPLLRGNDKKNRGNHDISVNGIWREIFSFKFCFRERKHFVHPWWMNK